MSQMSPARAAGLLLAVSLGLACAPSSAASQAARTPSRTGEGPHVRVELIADREQPGPGLWLGVRFDLDPSWHIYWLNPGDSGGPPQITWTLPPGLTAGETVWPAPERIDVGGLFNYGYHNEVVLSAQAAAAGAPPAQAGASSVGVSLRWMACSDMCVPGRAELELTFPLAEGERAMIAGWKAAIEAARQQAPKPAPPAWSASARSTRESFVVDVRTGSRETQAVFFPLEVSQVDDSAAQVVTPIDGGLRLTLRKSDQLVKDPSQLTGVLSLPGGRAFVVSAPVTR